MGAGIAQVAAVAGQDVTLQDVSDGALSRGRRQVEDSLARFEAKGRIAPEARTEALERISTTTDLDAAAEACGKTTVVVQRDIAGFVTTRIIAAVGMEAARLLEQGVISAEDLDTACRLGFGWAMGPLSTFDLTGVDVLYQAAMNIYLGTRDPKFLPPESVARMVEAGDLGRKTGRGFYDYDRG